MEQSTGSQVVFLGGAHEEKMKAIVPIEIVGIGDKRVQSINARYLWKGLEIGKDFSNWVKAQVQRGGFEENRDFMKFTNDSKLALLGEPEITKEFQTAIEYHLTLNCAKHICMMSQTEKGKQIREYFIWIEEEATWYGEFAHLLPRTHSATLKALAQKMDENDVLQTEIKVLAPKADFYDTVIDDKGGFSFAVVAKNLDYEGIGQNRLFDFCREIKILQEKPRNMPYQKYVECGYFRVVEQKIPGANTVITKTLILQRGIDYIRRKLNERGYHRRGTEVLELSCKGSLVSFEPASDEGMAAHTFLT